MVIIALLVVIWVNSGINSSSMLENMNSCNHHGVVVQVNAIRHLFKQHYQLKEPIFLL